MTRALFYGCWAGVALLLLHLVVARLRYKHWPSFLRLGGTFGTIVGLFTAVLPLWPILSEPDPAPILKPGEIVISLWMGFLASLGVAILALKDNLDEMARRCPPPAPATGGLGGLESAEESTQGKAERDGR